jgi:hypothetical protein
MVSLVIALCALAFTIGSFYWLYARIGTVRLAGAPRSFAFHQSEGRLVTTLPLALLNDGPTPIVLVNLRLRGRHPAFVADFIASHDEVYGDKGRAFATAIVIPGNDARLVILEFQGVHPDSLSVGSKSLTLEGLEQRLRGGARWRTLGEFALRIDENILQQKERFLVYDNRPG